MEQVALGNALRWNAPLELEDFRFPPHPDICRAILAVRAAGQRVGLMSVGEWLKANGLLATIGGTLYLTELMFAAEVRTG